MSEPIEITGSEMQIISKDGKKYFKRPEFKLSYYIYEEVKYDKIRLPKKKADVIGSHCHG